MVWHACTSVAKCERALSCSSIISHNSGLLCNFCCNGSSKSSRYVRYSSLKVLKHLRPDDAIWTYSSPHHVSPPGVVNSEHSAFELLDCLIWYRTMDWIACIMIQWYFLCFRTCLFDICFHSCWISRFCVVFHNLVWNDFTSGIWAGDVIIKVVLTKPGQKKISLL